jgi:hypothetical protein
MIGELPDHIMRTRAQLQADLPRNPQNAAFIQAKMAMLDNPGLADEIVNGRFWHEATAPSAQGYGIAIVTMFPQAVMQSDAARAAGDLGRGLPVLESFVMHGYPQGVIRFWYGFKIGFGGSGGLVDMEDRATYEIRTGPGRFPYEAGLLHELSHGFIGNESLTQFLEMYVYNVLQTGTPNLEAWAHTRGYVPNQSSNRDSAALLDVYRLIGPGAMSRAYQAVYPLRPPYGQPLSAAVQQAFVDEAPDAVRAQVADLVGRVTF